MTREADYPDNWRDISRSIRERSGGQCECEGECGLHSFHGGPRRCIEINGEPALYARGKIVLTVAHLNRAPDGPCRCDPKCGRPDHLKAMCQRCHLRYDVRRHVGNRRRAAEKESGQMRLAIFEGGK